MTSRLYEPLTADNAALILVDHQVGLMTGVRDYETGELKHNVVALAKAAKALGLPIVVTTTARDSLWGPTIPELVQALPGIEIIDRSSVNAYDDAHVAAAIGATGGPAAHGAGGCRAVRRRHADGRDPEGQWPAGGKGRSMRRSTCLGRRWSARS